MRAFYVGKMNIYNWRVFFLETRYLIDYITEESQLKKLLAVVLVIVFILTGCGDKSDKTELTVSAAASLTDSMNKIAAEYEKVSGVKVNLNLASSGTLQKQIENGAPTDLFLSASKSKMDKLVENGHIEKDNSFNLLENSIVLIVNKEYVEQYDSIEKLVNSDEKLSIGAPESVPAGKYSKEALENMNLYSKLEDRLVFGKNVKQVAKYVETGEIVAGIVYASDLSVLENVEVVMEIDSKYHSRIVYPLGIVESSDETKEFVRFLESDKALEIFKEYGFRKYTQE
jgi:molybdate transport system substrate-binding protein